MEKIQRRQKWKLLQINKLREIAHYTLWKITNRGMEKGVK
jgi:hypothetical protein